MYAGEEQRGLGNRGGEARRWGSFGIDPPHRRKGPEDTMHKVKGWLLEKAFAKGFARDKLYVSTEGVRYGNANA